MDTKKRVNPQSKTWSPRINNTSECTSSPEFEFWMVRNPSFPQPNILSADELFVDGVLLPLHLLSTHHKPTSEPRDPDPGLTSSTLSSSKRWKDIFRKSDKNNNRREREREDKTKKKERKGGATTSAELNINIWPFSRSRSAGNSGTRPKLFPGAPAARKINSAPCSRSNSAGESKSRKWHSSPARSPGRAGVHLGRSSPVWQVRRGGSTSLKNTEPLPLNPDKRKTTTVRRSKLASRSDQNNMIRGSNNGEGNGNVGNHKLFNLRSLFTKKSLVTSH